MNYITNCFVEGGLRKEFILNLNSAWIFVENKLLTCNLEYYCRPKSRTHFNDAAKFYYYWKKLEYVICIEYCSYFSWSILLRS